MEKDLRYTAAKRTIEKRDITNLNEVFQVIPKTVVAIDMGIAPARFSQKIAQVEKFSLKEVFRLAQLLDVDSLHIFKLAKSQHAAEKENKPSNKKPHVSSLIPSQKKRRTPNTKRE